MFDRLTLLRGKKFQGDFENPISFSMWMHDKLLTKSFYNSISDFNIIQKSTESQKRRASLEAIWCLGTLSCLPFFFQRETTLVTTCLISWRTKLFQKGKEFASRGHNFSATKSLKITCPDIFSSSDLNIVEL